MIRSQRNKTLDMTVEEGYKYLERCIKSETIKSKIKVSDIIDKTINGDTFETLSLLPYNFVDLLIVDPPYNIDKDFHGNKFKRISDNSYYDYTESWIKLVKPLLKENASIYVCCDWASSLVIGNVLKEHFTVLNRITWQREKGRGALTNWKNGMEDIWFAVNSNKYTFNIDSVKIRRKVIAPYKVDGKPKDWMETEQGNFRDTCPSNFWDDISIPYWSMPENTAHPTQKPEKLLAKLILASSNEGDIVLDPFLGSGTTSVTAKKLNRHYVGIEMNPQYCVWSERRLENADMDKSIQGFSDGVFWERNTNAIQKKFKNEN